MKSVRVLLFLFLASCATPRESHRTAAQITPTWLKSEIIDKGQPVRIVYLESDLTFERTGHLLASRQLDHVVLQYQDRDLAKIVMEEIAIAGIQDIWLIGASSYDNRMRDRWIRYGGLTVVFLIYLTFYFSD